MKLVIGYLKLKYIENNIKIMAPYFFATQNKTGKCTLMIVLYFRPTVWTRADNLLDFKIMINGTNSDIQVIMGNSNKRLPFLVIFIELISNHSETDFIYKPEDS